MAQGRFQTIPATTSLVDLAKHNDNLTLMDTELTRIETEMDAEDVVLQANIDAEAATRSAADNAESETRAADDLAHANSVAAHNATAIVFTPSDSGLIATNADTAIKEVNTRVSNIIAGAPSSAAEVIDARLGADGVVRADLGTMVREIHAQQLVADIQSAVLTHGWNYLLSDQASPLNLTIKGRTLVNILGKDGNCESLTPWTIGSGSAPVLSTTWKNSGTYSIKSVNTANISWYYKDYTYPLDTTKQYIIGGWVYIESFTSGSAPILRILDVGTATGRYSQAADTAIVGTKQFVYVKIPTSNTLVGTGFRFQFGTVSSTTTATYYFDDLRIYELSSTDYTAIGTTYTASTSPSINDFIPHVDSVKHVDGAYVRKSGKNLLPPFTQDWSLQGATLTIKSPYVIDLVCTANAQYTTVKIQVIPNTNYYLSSTHNARMAVYNETGATPIVAFTSSQGFTFNSGSNNLLTVIFGNNTLGAGTYTFTNPQLELGSSATEFVAQNNDYVYLPTRLASSIDRTVYDSVYYRDGAYRILRRLKTDVALDGSLTWAFGADYAGYKRIQVIISDGVNSTDIVTKYNGSILRLDDGSYAASDVALLFGGTLRITISDTDSGWGESFSPNASEMSAMVNGWKMNNGVFGTNYDGVGTKTWIPWGTTDNTGAVIVVPTTVSTAISGGTYDYYRLNYRLAASYVEEEIITGAEGSIGLHSGGNQININSGVIVRETVVPVTRVANDYYSINAISGYIGTSPLDYKSNQIIAVYKDGVRDLAWTIGLSADTAAWYGGAYAFIVATLYDPTAEYTVTYTKLNKYLYTGNVIDITGEYATTDRTVLDLTVQRLSDDEMLISVIQGLLNTTYLKGSGQRLQDGSATGTIVTPGTAVTVAVTFLIAYAIAPKIQLTLLSSAGGTAGYVNVFAENVTTTGFTLRVNSYVAGAVVVNWEAKG